MGLETSRATNARLKGWGGVGRGRPGLFAVGGDLRDPLALAGRRVLVVGAGLSGVAAADFLLRRGARVVVNDRRSAEALGSAAVDLARWGAKLVLGEHPERIFSQAELIVLSPGVPPTLPGLELARALGTEIIGEVELAARHLDAPIIAITGTNGKSTTTTFIGQLLRGSGRRAFVGGNLGTPLINAVDGDHDVVVAEISSFQLEAAATFRPHVAVLLNVTEDHLDRYPSFEAYAATKGQVFAHQRRTDFAVVNALDPRTVSLAEAGSAPIWAFSSEGPVERGAWLEDDVVHLGQGDDWTSLSLRGFGPRGKHNRENLMAALVATHLAGVGAESLLWGIDRLEGLSHRLELVGEARGLRWYNDSKATNVASVVASLSGLDEALVVLLGGKDKGGSYAPLVDLLAAKGAQAVVYGEAAPLIAQALAGRVPFHHVNTLAEAADIALQIAPPGASVVLSPACSSYDQFTDYRDRGLTFRRIVRGIGARGRESGGGGQP